MLKKDIGIPDRSIIPIIADVTGSAAEVPQGKTAESDIRPPGIDDINIRTGIEIGSGLIGDHGRIETIDKLLDITFRLKKGGYGNIIQGCQIEVLLTAHCTKY